MSYLRLKLKKRLLKAKKQFLEELIEDAQQKLYDNSLRIIRVNEKLEMYDETSQDE